MAHSQNVPVEYIDLQTLWNDRRDPHASPLSTSPRREAARSKGTGGLAKAVEGVYRPGADDADAPSAPLTGKRLYG